LFLVDFLGEDASPSPDPESSSANEAGAMRFLPRLDVVTTVEGEDC